MTANLWLSCIVFCLGAYGAEIPFRKVLPGGAIIHSETRVETYEFKDDTEAENAKVSSKAVVSTLYFASQVGEPEVVVQKFFLKLDGEEDMVGAIEPLYMPGFRILDVAQAKDRLLCLVQHLGSVRLIAVALDKKGNPTNKVHSTVVIPSGWEKREEGYLPIKSAHLTALPEDTYILFVSEEGHKMLWEVNVLGSKLMWSRKQGLEEFGKFLGLPIPK